MITYYVGSTGSTLGGPTQGITFSSTGIQVNGITGGGYPLFGTVSLSGFGSFFSDGSPIVFIDTPNTRGQSINVVLPPLPPNGTIVYARRVDSGTQPANLISNTPDFIILSGTTVGTLTASMAPSTNLSVVYNNNSWWQF